MNIRKEIEVGKIEPQIFQLYCIKALQRAYSCHKSNEGYSIEHSRNVDTHIYIDIVNPTGIRVTLTESFPVTDMYFVYNITYRDDFIIIQCKADYVTKCYISIEERNAYINDTEQHINEQQQNLTDILLRSFSFAIKKHSEIYKIPIHFKPVFNPITCINTTSHQIENIRLTPHGSIKNINKPSLYDGTKLFERKMEFVASDKGEYCISADRDIYDNGSVYELGNTKIKRLIQSGHSETWLPLCSLIADTNIKINTPLYVKPKDSEKGVWLYIAINGIIYDNTIIKAGMEYHVIETENGPQELIIYKDNNQEISLPLVTNELMLTIKDSELAKPVVLDIERVVKPDIFASDTEEFVSLKANIEKLNNSLIDRNYYDGTKFEELLTYRSWRIKREEEWEKQEKERKKQEKERKKQELEEFKVRANENIERFKQSTIDMFKGLTQKKKETSKTDNPEAESPSNVENTGGFKEYYKKHKIGVWIGVVAIIFLVSTCG